MPDLPLALITGAAHRLGKAFALALAGQGYAILLHYHTAEQEALQTAEQIRSMGVPVFLRPADLARAGQVHSLFSDMDAIPHTLKVLVNSAALMARADAHALSAEEWDATFDLNVRAAFLCAQLAFQRMTHGGLIVNVSDVAAQKAWHIYPAYTVSKAAVESLTRVLARAFAPGVRVNAIAPGLVLQSDIVSAGEWEKMVARLPLPRPAELGEITAALEYLLENEYVTGQTLVVDGGYSLRG